MSHSVRTLIFTLLLTSASCGGSSLRDEGSLAQTTSPLAVALSARQRATVCTKQDRGRFGGFPPPKWRRLARPDSPWFDHVQLDPPSTNAQPTISLAQAWGDAASMFVSPSAIYDVVLADWTSDDSIVTGARGHLAPHRRVLAWVAIGKHVPIDASDVDFPSRTIPGVPCYFGTSITAVDATTGNLIADASDYH